MLHTGVRAGGGRAACCTRERGRRTGGGACRAPGGHVDGGTCCGVRVRCGQRGRQSCGMPLILER
eukprot:5513547-Prymnesium_polylepis.1